VAVLWTLAALPPRLPAQAWSVQVDKVDPGDVNIEPAFRVAIYANLFVELAKTKQFKQIFRGGDRNAGGPEDLILKTTVQKYTPGIETRRERGYKVERPKPALCARRAGSSETRCRR
jgi:hypothetical protein